MGAQNRNGLPHLGGNRLIARDGGEDRYLSGGQQQIIVVAPADDQYPAVREVRGRVIRTGRLKAVREGPRIGHRVVDLGAPQADEGVLDPADNQDPAVREDHCAVTEARRLERGRGGPRIRRRGVQLRVVDGSGEGTVVPRSDQHPAVVQECRRVQPAGLVQASGRGPAVGGGIVEFRTGQAERVLVPSPYHQDLAARQQRGRM